MTLSSSSSSVTTDAAAESVAEQQVAIRASLAQQRQFFAQGYTRDPAARRSQLQQLRKALLDRQDEFTKALQADLGKSVFEVYGTEFVPVLEEIKLALQQLAGWVRPRRVPAPLFAWPAQAEISPEPLGVVLIIGPWNYPLMLMLMPLVGAIVAGNCVVLKPSELAPATSAVLAQLIRETFAPEWITIYEGGVDTSQALLSQSFDHIFFTGSPRVGKVVMAAAAQHLTPVTLELGGKSPCIVDETVPLDVVAQRIAWGKFLNAGQSCIAPDYVLVDRRVKADLVAALGQQIQKFYGADPAQSPDYGRIVNDNHWARLVNLIKPEQVAIGGESDPDTRYIAPTILTNVSWDDPVMQTEIFGPILPVLEFTELEAAISSVNRLPKPLALYLFSRDRQRQKRVLQETSAGGVSINETFLHAGVPSLPFGGVGQSGIGKYHGKASFETFSHFKSVLYRGFAPEIDWRSPPYAGKLKWLKWFFG